MVGFHLRHRLDDRLGCFDGVGGAVLVACLGLFLAWVGGAVALQTPGARELREPIQRSAILGRLNDALPPSGPLLQALARFDPFPEIEGPDADVRAPSARIARDPQVREAARSVVRVLGTACGLGVQGSGWVVGDGVVVTNAHVVAGQDDTTVQIRGEGERIDADAIWFDSRNDLALLRAPGLAGARAAAERGSRSRRLRRDSRLPRERAVHGRARPARGSLEGRDAGRLRPRADHALDRLAARPGPLGQLGRPDGGRRGPGSDHDLRGLGARRRGLGLRRSRRARAASTRAGSRRGGHRALRLAAAAEASLSRRCRRLGRGRRGGRSSRHEVRDVVPQPLTLPQATEEGAVGVHLVGVRRERHGIGRDPVVDEEDRRARRTAVRPAGALQSRAVDQLPGLENEYGVSSVIAS